MPGYYRLSPSEQQAHLLLCQPDGLAVRLNLEADVIRRLVNHDLLFHVFSPFVEMGTLSHIHVELSLSYR